MLIIRKLISVLLCLGLMASLCPAASGESEPSVSAHSAIVMEQGGRVFCEKNADEKLPMASTTKIMTAILCIEGCDLSQQVDIVPEYCRVEGSSMYLRTGQRYTVEELLKGLMLASGNDAAIALACTAAGSVEKFVALMNDKAEELGLKDTQFLNPNGLPEEGHYSTARDMAVLMDYCMENEDFARICGMEYCNVGQMTLYNHNRLLRSLNGCIGGKTGFTKKAGRCLVSCTQRRGERIICVTLSAPDDWNDHIKLTEWVYGKFAEREVLSGLTFSVPVVSGSTRYVELRVEDCSPVYAEKSAELTITAEMPRFVFAPVEEGARAGSVKIRAGDRLIDERELVYAEGADAL